MVRQKAADEIFCKSCGKAIKKQAEICPHCGVRNEESVGTSTNGSFESDDLGDIAPYIAWAGGIILLLAGLGVLGESDGQLARSIIASIILTVTGLFSLPPVRKWLATRKDIRFERGAVGVIVIVGFILGSAIGPS